MTVQARLRKLLKRLAASPMRRRDYLLAPVLARLVFLGARGRGSAGVRRARVWHADSRWFISIALVSLAGALMCGALGLLMGSRARTFEAASGLMNLMSVPMWVLSGVFFSASQLPGAGAAVHPGAAADGAGRCAARRRARRRDADGHLERAGDHGGMDDRAVRDRAENLQVAVTVTSRRLDSAS